MKAIRPKAEQFDTRTLSTKMQDQEKAIQRKEDREKAAAKSQAEREKAEVQPVRAARTREELEDGGETDWKFHIENRLSDIQNQLIHLTGLIVDRLPKSSALEARVKNAPPPVPTVNGGHPVAPNGKVALFVEVPTLETVMAAAKKYKERHTGEALKEALGSFGVTKISELTEEQRAQFLERISDDKPEAVDG